MNIALDYDGTHTADPALWDAFIRTAIARGHDVRCVTMRYPSEEITVPCPVIYTGRKAKLEQAAERGFIVKVLIDDMPHFILESAAA